jgi:WD40 repeat protein
VVRGVCCLRFSNGGQFLAAAYPRQKNSAQKSSVHLINIYNSYTLEEVGRLNDHSALITDLCWKSDDRALYSVGTDGTTTEWKQGDPKSENKDWQGKKWSQPNSKYTSVIY